MIYCNNCGNKLKENLIFCTKCGTEFIKAPKNQSFCKKCGKTLEDENHVCTPSSVTIPNDTQTGARNTTEPSSEKRHVERDDSVNQHEGNMGKKNSRLKWIISIVAVFIVLISSAVGFLFYEQSKSSPAKLVEKFTAALSSNNKNDVESLITGTTEIFVGEEEIKNLLSEFKDNPELLKKVKANLNAQEKNLDKKSSKTAPLVFEIIKSKEKKYYFINQYHIAIHPVSFSISVDDEARLYVNGAEIDSNNKGKWTVKNTLPGKYELKATKKTELGSFVTKKTIEVWEETNDDFELNFEGKYVTVINKFSEIDLYVNGDFCKKTKEPTIKIGPLPVNETITIQGLIDYPSGEAKTNEYTVAANKSITLEFPEMEKGIETEVYNSILDYNRSYIEAITYLDTSLLRSIENPKHDETVKIVNDLEQRNVYYTGNLKNIVFDTDSFSFLVDGDDMTASVNVQESFNSGWKKIDALEEPKLTEKKYFYTYKMKYNSFKDAWVVTETQEHKTLDLKNTIVLGP